MSNVTLKDVYVITYRIEEKLDGMEKRVSAIEIWKAEIVGKLTIFAALVSMGIGFAWDFVKSKFLKNV
jgi:hypothetical protein